MKKLRSAVYAGVLAATSVAAHAQVTVYGSVDAGVDYVTNSGGGKLTAVNSGKRQPDRIGFRGAEDLGGGNTAFFRLESGLNIDNGSAIRSDVFFNRYAQVGLANASVGTLTLGHMPDFLYEYLATYSDAVPGLSSSFSPGNLDNLANMFQIDNAVKYETPVIGGFQAGAIHGFGETAGDFNRGRRYSAGARFENGPFKVAAAYAMYHDRPADIRGTFGLTSFQGTPIAPGATFLTSRFRTAGVGAAYAAGIFTPHVLVTDVRLENAAGASSSERNYHAGVNIDISGGRKVDLLGVSYMRSNFESLRFNQYNLFLEHNLSKRTQVYTGLSYQRASGPSAMAEFTGYRASSTDAQTLLRVGVHHLF